MSISYIHTINNLLLIFTVFANPLSLTRHSHSATFPFKMSLICCMRAVITHIHSLACAPRYADTHSPTSSLIVHILNLSQFIYSLSYSSYTHSHTVHILTISQFIYSLSHSSYTHSLTVHILTLSQFIYSISHYILP